MNDNAAVGSREDKTNSTVKKAVREHANVDLNGKQQAPPDQNNETEFDQQQQVDWTFGLDQEGIEFEFDDIAFDQQDEDFLQGMQQIPNPHLKFDQPPPQQSQRKMKEVSLLERFGLLSNEQISDDESDEDSIRTSRTETRSVPSQAATRDDA